MSKEVVRQTRQNNLPATVKFAGGTAVSFKASYAEIKQREAKATEDKAKAADYDRVKELAMRDSLTGLYTRRALDDEFKRVVNTMRRHHTDHENNPDVAEVRAVMVLLDVDHFKQVNDQRGHKAGDEVLKNVAETLVNGTRRSDAVARWGGEEMAILLEETDMEGGLLAAENLRLLIEEGPSDVTATFGVVEVYPDLSLEDVMAQADRALYYGKQHGRNQVVGFKPWMPNKPGVEA